MMRSKIHRAVNAYLATAATPFSKSVEKCLDENRVGDILKMRVNPSDYTSAEAYLIDAQCLAFFKKNADLETGVDRKAAALTAWWEAEHRCARTNATLSRILCGPHDLQSLALLEFLEGVRKRVSDWLGPLPNHLYGRFGPGVTLCCRGSVATVPDKMSTIPTTTTALLPYLKWWEESAWARALNKRSLLYDEHGSLRVNITDWSEWSSVTKNAETDRSIEIGPSLNVFHQLFIGRLMKDRFASRGWDLRNSADIHVQVARRASITGDDATIDLKSASDSLSRMLVKCVTPVGWYQLFDDLRTKRIKLPDGKMVWLEKFSGMGNGFTFELESVIFMAVCQEVLARLGMPNKANHDVFVYGDDIIVRTEAASSVIKMLALLGFQTNELKTFVKGPFRESCGGDFFQGVAVRPFFLEGDPDTPEKLIVFANGLRACAFSSENGFARRDTWFKPWLRVLDSLPTSIRRCRGPSELGDIVIHDEPSTWDTRTKFSRRYLRCYREVDSKRDIRRGGTWVAWDNFHEDVMLAARILGLNSDYGVKPRYSTDGRRIRWVGYS